MACTNPAFVWHALGPVLGYHVPWADYMAAGIWPVGSPHAAVIRQFIFLYTDLGRRVDEPKMQDVVIRKAKNYDGQMYPMRVDPYVIHHPGGGMTLDWNSELRENILRSWNFIGTPNKETEPEFTAHASGCVMCRNGYGFLCDVGYLLFTGKYKTKNVLEEG
jgi:hypothetical protein